MYKHISMYIFKLDDYHEYINITLIFSPWIHECKGDELIKSTLKRQGPCRLKRITMETKQSYKWHSNSNHKHADTRRRWHFLNHSISELVPALSWILHHFLWKFRWFVLGESIWFELVLCKPYRPWNLLIELLSSL